MEHKEKKCQIVFDCTRDDCTHATHSVYVSKEEFDTFKKGRDSLTTTHKENYGKPGKILETDGKGTLQWQEDWWNEFNEGNRKNGFPDHPLWMKSFIENVERTAIERERERIIEKYGDEFTAEIKTGEDMLNGMKCDVLEYVSLRDLLTKDSTHEGNNKI